MIKNRTYHSSDSPGYFYTSEISVELDRFYLDLKSKYPELPFYIFVVLRCLLANSNWVTKARFSIDEDSNNTIKGEMCLGIDVVVLEEELKKIPNIRNNKVEQRLLFGRELMTILTEKITKSAKKIPYLNAHKERILIDINQWCLENYWLKEDSPIHFKIKNWPLSKADLIFGKPISKIVTNEMDKNIFLEANITALKYQHINWNIDENRQIESWFYLSEKKEWICCWCLIK
jgi:hypothetical protein